MSGGADAACVVLAHRLGGRGGPAYSRLTGVIVFRL
jgi:hypothetical protein